MSGQQRVNGVDLANLENNLGSVLESMGKQVSALQTSIDELAARWTGIGANEFKRQQSQINEDHRALQRILNGIKDAIELTRKGKDANEEEVLQNMRSIDGLSDAPKGATLDSVDTGAGTARHSGFDKF